MLADPKSEIIRKFGVLNLRATEYTTGSAIPGYFYVGVDGKVRETFFEEHKYARYTANNLIAKLFPELAESQANELSAPHLRLKLIQSDTLVVPGSRVALFAEVSLPPDVHVYAPGVKGYKPIAFQLEPMPQVLLRAVRYPPSKVLFLPAIRESVPVFEGRFRIAQDVTVAYDKEFIKAVTKGPASGTILTLKGTLLYQACDKTICYLPSRVAVSWQLTVKPPDESRAPEAIRHK